MLSFYVFQSFKKYMLLSEAMNTEVGCCLALNVMFLGPLPNFTSIINPLSPNITKWSNTLEEFVDELFECV